MLDSNPFYRIEQELKSERPRWGLWTTLLWTFFIMLAAILVEQIAGLRFLEWRAAVGGGNGAYSDVEYHGALLGVARLASTPVAVGLVLLAVRLTGKPAGDYLGLKLPSRRNLLIGLLIVAVLVPVGDIVAGRAAATDNYAFILEAYGSARETGLVFLIALGLAVVVFGPLTEELIFRGFLFRGVADALGPFAAIAITAAMWTAPHTQYSAPILVQTFVIGLVLGWLRWRSGSLILVFLLHALVNAGSLAYAALGVDL